MKKINTWIVLLFSVMNYQFTYAQMDNLANLSSEWISTGARNAAYDGSDIVFYNPAAITKLSDGLHVNFSNQSLFRKPTHTYDLGLGDGPKTFSQSGSDPFLPNLFETYKKKKFAFFTGVFNTGGGATMNYPTGSLTTDLMSLQTLGAAGGAYTATKNQNLKATSMYLTTTLGGTYMINNKISFAIAGRYTRAKNTTTAGLTLSSSPVDLPDQELNYQTEELASGISGVISVDVMPSERLNLSMRYESRVKLDFRTRKITDDFGMATDGQMNRRDLPAVLALGAAFRINQKLTGFADFNYYYQQNADWGKSTVATAEIPWSILAGNAASYGLGFKYRASNRITASLGCGYTHYNYLNRNEYYSRLGTFEVVQDNNYNINTGVTIKASERVKFNLGYMHAFWAKDQKINAVIAQPLNVDVTVNSSLSAVAFGIDIAF